MDGIRDDHDEPGCGRSTGDVEVDGSQGRDHDGRSVCEKMANRGAKVYTSAGRDADVNEVMAAMLIVSWLATKGRSSGQEVSGV
jgi:hypothetical protein